MIESSLALSYDYVRRKLNQSSSTNSIKEANSRIITSTVNKLNGNHCNGTYMYKGCYVSPLPAGKFLLVEGTGSYWCVACAKKYGLEEGMVKSSFTHFSDSIFSKTAPKKMTKKHSTIECLNINAIRSQKATGVAVITTQSWHTPPTILIQGESDLDRIEEVLECIKEDVGVPVWARPCPTRPRHGFLESRVVETPADVVDLWKKTVAIEKDAELMLQPMVQADVSGILTPNKLVWGPGNDGATSGRGAQSLKLGQTKTEFLSSYVLEKSRLTSKDDPYLEIVWHKNEHRAPIFVQLRGGPRVEAVNDYVPRKRKVKYIYVLDSDVEHVTEEALLIWEKAAKEFKPGTVVYHKGGDVTSHYGVHCVTNKIPYFTTRCPEVGETIKPEVTLEDFDIPALRTGLKKGYAVNQVFANNSNSYKRITLFSMFTLHNSVADHGPISSEMLGFSAACLFRMMALACLGELRHFGPTHGQAAQNQLKEDTALKELLHGAYMSDNRHAVFNRHWELPIDKLAEHLSIATRCFLRDKWSGGMGGLRWGKCGLYALHLYEAIRRVDAYPTSRNVRHLINRMNTTVNLVHNGGSLFNKFTKADVLGRACKLDRSIMFSQVVPIIFYLPTMKTAKLAKKVQWKSTVSRELRSYGHSKTSIKRVYSLDGKLDTYVEKRAAIVLMSTIRSVWHAYVLDMCIALQNMFAPPPPTPSKTCGECGFTRSMHAKTKDVKQQCISDCDMRVAIYNRYHYVIKITSQRLSNIYARSKDVNFKMPGQIGPTQPVVNRVLITKAADGIPSLRWKTVDGILLEEEGLIES